MPAKKSEKNLFWHIVLIYIISRGVLEIIGVLSMFYFPSARANLPITDLKYHSTQPHALEMWARWDSEWYLLISEKGYDSYDVFREFGHGRYLREDTAKFFPLYPLTIRLLSYVVQNSVFAGVLVSNLAAILFLYYFYLLASRLFDPETGIQGSLFYIFFPTSFFLSAVYSESIFLATVLAAFYYLEEKKLIPALIASVLMMLARPQAILAIPSLILLAWRQFPERRPVVLFLLTFSCLISLLGYSLYIQQVFGSSQWIAESQQYWRGAIRYPLYALVRFARSDIAIHGQHNSMIDFCFAMINLVVLAVSFRRLPLSYSLFSFLIVIFPLTSSLFSFSRLCLPNFPFFLYLGSELRGRWALLIQIVFAMLLAFFMAAFASWYWVG